MRYSTEKRYTDALIRNNNIAIFKTFCAQKSTAASEAVHGLNKLGIALSKQALLFGSFFTTQNFLIISISIEVVMERIIDYLNPIWLILIRI